MRGIFQTISLTAGLVATTCVMAQGFALGCLHPEPVLRADEAAIGTRGLNVYCVQPLAHVDGMLMAYPPEERLLIEADLFDTHEPSPGAPTAANLSLLNEVRSLDLDVATIVPIHVQTAAWSDFVDIVEQ